MTGASKASASTPTPASAGECLDTGGTVVSCDRNHKYEVISNGGSCNLNALVTYLGGVPGLDTLATSIRAEQLNVTGNRLCVLALPASAPVFSVRHILDISQGDAWRRCLDNRFENREVSCAESHTDEFVFSGVLAAGERLDCAARAANYLGADFSIYAQDLDLRSASQGSASQCLVSVRGNNLLTASVRRIGTNALPITPG
jgi:hypothetical protein